ncbi:MAG: RNA polymerase sigma-70 factor [Sphingobacteriaceae bacterium]|nr:RNA polymerase sigma-70 factor [Sphingobacteriaceae bacterium]
MARHDRLSEHELLLSLKKGDHDAFTAIYNTYWEEMANTAYQRLRSREDAEEVVQEVFVSLYIRRDHINPKTSLISYLRTALKYKVIDAFRAQQLHSKYLCTIINNSIEPDASPDERLCIKELQQNIREIIEKLPSKCQEVFLKSRFEQLSHQGIADNMGISISTVKKHLYKASQVLKKELKKDQSDLLIIFAIFLLKK